jgi:hypothetical protein
MAHDRFCDYRPSYIIEGGLGCICDFVESIRVNERKIIALRIGADVLHQKENGKYSTCAGCRRRPCELEGDW